MNNSKVILKLFFLIIKNQENTIMADILLPLEDLLGNNYSRIENIRENYPDLFRMINNSPSSDEFKLYVKHTDEHGLIGIVSNVSDEILGVIFNNSDDQPMPMVFG